jgi:hypothetical protein
VASGELSKGVSGSYNHRKAVARAHWKDGQIIEEKLFYDLVGLLRQVGVLPSSSAAKAV